MNGVFVTATDTAVGKTVITAGLALALSAEGFDIGIAKPVQSGNLADDPDGDAMRLKALTGISESPDEIVASSFSASLAPLVAARLEGTEIHGDVLVDHVRALAARHQAILVEGAGGLLVPLAEGFTVADFAVALGLPLLVVARPGLGTVNHTALTVLVARSLGLQTVGVILNGAGPETDPSVFTNAELVESLADVPVLGVTPFLDGELDSERVKRMIVDHVNLEPVRALLGEEAA